MTNYFFYNFSDFKMQFTFKKLPHVEFGVIIKTIHD